jgi:Na+-transporting NADH:ubiquinone oxidoreductase subunit A
MSRTVKLKKGLDIRLVGEADKVVSEFVLPASISIKPADFHGLIPKMVVKEGDSVLAGDVLFFNKYEESIKCVSPVSGTVKEIRRGAKRRIMEVIVESDGQQTYKDLGVLNPADADAAAVKEYLMSNGLWMNNSPKAIYVSGFDSSPLAPDYDFILHGEDKNFQAGLDALKHLTSGKVNLVLNANVPADAVFTGAKRVELCSIAGRHPAGNVGTQIHHFDPINKGEFVWTVNPQDVTIIGRAMLSGKYDSTKMINLTGSEAKARKYYKTLIGAQLDSIIEGNISSDNVRVISGNPLTGDRVEANSHLGFYHNQVAILPEGDEYKFFLTTGWLGLGFDKFSNSRLFPTWLTPNKKFTLDTNTNGEERGFVVTGEMEKVFPFDILPMQLVKAAITDDIDAMENLGIYEVIPEDFALCEYVCTSKINIQDKIRQALDLIQEECM